MPGLITLPLASPDSLASFDLHNLIRHALTQQGDNEYPQSPTLSDSSSISSLSSLPPSPELGPSDTPATSSQPPAIFLDPSDAVLPPPKRQKKNPDKTTTAHRQARKNAAANNSRRKRRARKKEELVQARSGPKRKHLGSAKPITLNDFDAHGLPSSQTGYIGVEKGPKRPRFVTLKDALGKHKLVLQKWDGSFSAGVVDQNSRVVAILAGRPKDKDWPLLQAQGLEALERYRPQCLVPKAKRRHRRGQFLTLNCGVSFGGGQRAPANLQNDPPNDSVLSELNALPVFKRLAGFASSVMATWAPKLFDYYHTMNNLLYQRHPSLVKIFPTSIFSAVSYNFGPQTVCYPHIDPGNLAFGECSVTPFGVYDYTKGGHLILWDLKMAIEFPPGCTILFPSAVITHSNVAIAKHEIRHSFVQYTAGGLFRWVDQGFQTQEKQQASLSQDDLEKEKKRIDRLWEFGLSLLPTAFTLKPVGQE